MENELKSGIYCIENIANNKKYIGQAYDINNRWRKHKYDLNNKSHYNDHLQKAWNKYGQDNFNFYVLEYCEIESLDEKEKYYIDLYNVINRKYGYNNKTGGQNGGSRYSEESRIKMSEVQKKICEDKERIAVLRENSLKTWADDEYKKSRSGENHPMYGKHLSEEHRQKISTANKGKSKPPRSKEHCEALSKSHKGKVSRNRNNTPVRCIELDMIFDDAITAGKELNLKHPNHVIDVCMGRRKTCGGFHFEFVKENKEEE